jgi:hypothetical protein
MLAAEYSSLQLQHVAAPDESVEILTAFFAKKNRTKHKDML